MIAPLPSFKLSGQSRKTQVSIQSACGSVCSRATRNFLERDNMNSQSFILGVLLIVPIILGMIVGELSTIVDLLQDILLIMKG